MAGVLGDDFRIFHSCPARHLFIYQKYALPEFWWKLTEEMNTRDQPLFPNVTLMKVSPIKSKVFNDQLPFKVRHEQQGNYERIEVSYLSSIYPRQYL